MIMQANPARASRGKCQTRVAADTKLANGAENRRKIAERIRKSMERLAQACIGNNLLKRQSNSPAEAK